MSTDYIDVAKLQHLKIDSATVWRVGAVDLIIPVYKNKDLTARCLESLTRNIAEIQANSPRVIVVNDSPDDLDVTQYLREMESRGIINLLIENKQNVGFVRSVNRALRESKDRGASAILVNSDTEVFAGTLSELVTVADLDDQFAFVCPRSNNASICTFPRPPHSKGGATLTPEATHSVWKELKELLPRYTYAPTAIGFFMLIKSVVLRNFEALDERFGAGYEEENDLVMRAGKVGFRAVIANHAFAYHAGSASFALTDLRLDDHRLENLQKIGDLHPEFLPNVRAYESSPEYRAELFLKGLLRDSNGALDIAFVLSSMGQHFNGTNEFIVNVLKSFVEKTKNRFNVTLICDPETARFHGLDKLPRVRVKREIDSIYAIAFSFGQPYDLHMINVMEMIAPVVVYCMLDVISLDCGSLRNSQNVKDLWEYVAEEANGIVFISKFSRDTFVRRFPTTEAALFATLLSTRTGCYADRYENGARGERHVFVAGNHFDHKDSSRVGRLLGHAFPSLTFVVLGARGVYPPNAEVWQSGSVEDSRMIEAICESSAVVLPSFYEGFGFTLMHALAAGKPIVARDIPATREILAQFKGLSGVYLFSDDAELREAVARAIETGKSSFERELGYDWQRWSSELAGFLEGIASDRSTIYSRAVSRIKHGDKLRSQSLLKARSHVPPASRVAPTNRIVSWGDMERMDADRFVDEMYEHILGRPADDIGKLHHLQLLKDGRTKEELVLALFDSHEYQQADRKVQIENFPTGRGRSVSRIRSIFRRWG
jgi:GT2 family glycosyltransferase